MHVQLDLCEQGLVEGHGQGCALGSKEGGGVVLRDDGSLLVSLQRFRLDLRRRAATTCPDRGDMHVLDVEVLQDELEFCTLAACHRAEVVAGRLEHLRRPVLAEGGPARAAVINAAWIILSNMITDSYAKGERLTAPARLRVARRNAPGEPKTHVLHRAGRENLRERKPPFREYGKAVEFRQRPALEPDSESTAKAQSDRDPRLAVVPTRAIIIATLVDRPIIAAVSGRIAIRTWVVAVWTGLVVTIGRLAGVTSVRYGGDRRLVIDPLVAVPDRSSGCLVQYHQVPLCH